jgi:hypothetical protein
MHYVTKLLKDWITITSIDCGASVYVYVRQGLQEYSVQTVDYEILRPNPKKNMVYGTLCRS